MNQPIALLPTEVTVQANRNQATVNKLFMKALWLVVLVFSVSLGAGSAAETSKSPTNELSKAREKLTNLLQNYTEKHPAVIVQFQKVSELEAKDLNRLTGELNLLLTQYTEAHPLVQEKRRQIADFQATERSYRTALSEPKEVTQLKKAFADLNALLERYTDAHPLVQQKRAEIARLDGSK